MLRSIRSERYRRLQARLSITSSLRFLRVKKKVKIAQESNLGWKKKKDEEKKKFYHRFFFLHSR